MPTDDNFLYLTSISQRVNEIMNNTQKVSKSSQKKKPLVKQQTKTIPDPRSKIKLQRKSILVPGNHEDNSLAQPTQKLRQLKQNIRRQQNKPTVQQQQEYYELSEEIERRGDAYFQQLEELYNPKEKQHGENKKSKI